jgi:Mn-dependent DtxR family transcriptional regulator
MKPISELSRAKEHYLKAIFRLSQNECGTRVIDVATELGVTRASSSRTISELESAGFVRKTSDRKVFLTPRGRNMSRSLVEHYDTIKELLMTRLGIEENLAREMACALEHIITEEGASELTRDKC